MSAILAHLRPAFFRSIDLAAANAGVNAASSVGIRHFIYVSVAHPAPLMKAYIAVRMEAEQSIRAARLDATILRPWYVLGPGRRWPVALLPMYWILGVLPHTRNSARRLGLVTLTQMVRAITWSVEFPTTGVRILEVPQIRAAGLSAAAA